MSDTFRAAVVQMNSGEDKEANLRRAADLVEQAASAGAQLVALPEMFNCLGRFSVVFDAAEPIPGSTSRMMSELARRLRISLLAGSICERGDSVGKAYNTSLLFDRDGRQVASYRKVHLFDVDLPGHVTVSESNWIVPGNQVVTSATELGRCGLSICYDLRFPELYRHLAAQRIETLFVPAAFTLATGRDHWEVLLRARAIENQAYVIAPNQCGRHGPALTTYGHSMIVDPWGIVLARLDSDEGIATAEIDLQRVREIRTQLPALDHRRLDLDSTSDK